MELLIRPIRNILKIPDKQLIKDNKMAAHNRSVYAIAFGQHSDN